MNDISLHVKKFRNSIVELVKSEALYDLNGFPRGQCNNAAYLLGTYLEAQGFGEFDAVGARSTDESSNSTHSWLEQIDLVKGNLVIDITGSQFPTVEEEIYIGYSPKWLANWHEIDRDRAKIFDDRLQLGQAYNSIFDNIEHSKT